MQFKKNYLSKHFYMGVRIGVYKETRKKSRDCKYQIFYISSSCNTQVQKKHQICI